MQVTAADGAEAVTQRKKWREIGRVFNLPATTTSVSYVLKRGYLSYLWDYEQVLSSHNLCVSRAHARVNCLWHYEQGLLRVSQPQSACQSACSLEHMLVRAHAR